MCSWQQETASLAGGLATYPSLGSSSGHPSAAKPADGLMGTRVEGISAASMALQAAGRVSAQGAGDAMNTSHADLLVTHQACSQQARRMTSSVPKADARRAGFNNNSSRQPVAEVAKASRKRAADTSCAEPATKRLLRGESSNMQLTGATAAVLGDPSHGQRMAAAAVPTSGGGGSSARAAQHGSAAGAAEMAEGEAGGRRRVVKVRKGRALQLLKDECDQGDEGFQAMEVC